MRSMRASDTEVVQRHTQPFLTRVLRVNGFDIVRNNQFLRIIFSDDADLESD
jgi:hypothetical protein